MGRTKENEMPLIVLQDMLVFPEMTLQFDLEDAQSIAAAKAAMLSNQLVFLVLIKDTETSFSMENVNLTGVIATVTQMVKITDATFRVTLVGKERGVLCEINQKQKKYYCGMVCAEKIAAIRQSANRQEAMRQLIMGLFIQFGKESRRPDWNLHGLEKTKDIGKLMDLIVNSMPIAPDKKQEVLNAVSIKERFEVFQNLMLEEINIAKIRQQLMKELSEQVDHHQKEYLLREQLAYIQKELSVEENEVSELEQYEAEVKKLVASDEVKSKIQKEIHRLKINAHGSSEGAVERAYIETLLELPWDKVSEDAQGSAGLEKAKYILDRDHYGLLEVKERILEYLAVRMFGGKKSTTIICLVGPPGTGKTSIAKSVAAATDKKYLRICLGGVRDEAEIRGHRKTYIGAMPGRIVSGLKQAGVKNPLMLLDEIDKMSQDYKGDPASAMLEVLDSQQNNSFSDHYVEIPIDLSEIFFIATANDASAIPQPLLDRMEIIEIAGYTENEKFHIAKEHLIKKTFEKNGIAKKHLQISDAALHKIIQCYTREAGVRELERKIDKLCRKAAMELLSSKQEATVEKIKVTEKNLEHYLGKIRYPKDHINHKDEIGIVRGLAWTCVGGDTLEIEVNIMPGKGELLLTGQLGDVMKESAMAGISYIRSISERYDIAPEYYQKNDIHIHIPEGAVPKDGPSAGITMATAVLSAILKKKVRKELAMTGEISLRGKVMPVGGLKEKILAARMAGIQQILVPAENRKDIEEINPEIKEGVKICYVSRMDEVIAQAFC